MIIKNLFNTILTCNKYNVNTESDSNIIITVTCKDFNGNPVIGEKIELSYDNQVLTNLTTNLEGTANYTYDCSNDSFGLHTFSIDTGAVAQIEVYRDTGWIQIEYTTDYQNYSGEQLVYRVYNNLFELRGIFTNKKPVTPDTDGIIIGSIPVKYAPSKAIHRLQQGSYANKFVLSVETSGNIYFARYGTTATNTQVPSTGAWLHAFIKYLL